MIAMTKRELLKSSRGLVRFEKLIRERRLFLECGDLSPLSYGSLAKSLALRSLGTLEEKRRQVAALQISRAPDSQGVFQRPASALTAWLEDHRQVC